MTGVSDKYTSGEYFRDPARYGDDATFKVGELSRLLQRQPSGSLTIDTFADVGCGSGAAAEMLKGVLSDLGHRISEAYGFDISPHVAQLRSERVRLVHGDFCTVGPVVDLVVLFDVIEHVADPSEFLRAVAGRCRWIALHIPLDDTVGNAARDNYLRLMRGGGHITFFNTVSALNLLSAARLQVIDYLHTRPMLPPRAGLRQRLLHPVRSVFGRLSPGLVAGLLGGTMMVLVETPKSTAT